MGRIPRLPAARCATNVDALCLVSLGGLMSRRARNSGTRSDAVATFLCSAYALGDPLDRQGRPSTVQPIHRRRHRHRTGDFEVRPATGRCFLRINFFRNGDNGPPVHPEHHLVPQDDLSNAAHRDVLTAIPNRLLRSAQPVSFSSSALTGWEPPTRLWTARGFTVVTPNCAAAGALRRHRKSLLSRQGAEDTYDVGALVRNQPFQVMAGC